MKKLASDAGVFFTRAVQVKRLLACLPGWLAARGRPAWAPLQQTLAAAVGQAPGRCCCGLFVFHPWTATFPIGT